LSCITDRKKSVDSMYEAFSRVQGDQYEAHSGHHSLPTAEDMDRILRYEERMHRQLDWALQRLLESQERRNTSQSPTASTLLVTAERLCRLLRLTPLTARRSGRAGLWKVSYERS
jgi:hypothetical protein